MVIDHGKVTYANVEKDFTQVTVSGVDPVLKAL
jgi:peroxiredoxin